MNVWRARGIVVLVAIFSAAPTVGDVGGCGQTAIELAPSSFAAAKKQVDCERCQECELLTSRCETACNPAAIPEDTIPSTCHPLIHDGEVCTRALRAASCDDYADFVRDDARRVPTECEFCRAEPQTGPSLGAEGGVL